MFNAPDDRQAASRDAHDPWDCHLGALFIDAVIAICILCQLIAIALALGAVITPGFI